jgi:hypothetical protein
VAFSVEPSTSASGCLLPAMSMPNATTQQDSAKCTPSIINATRSSPARTRGRVIGTRRPPRVTDPRSRPCRTAIRTMLYLPFGPANVLTSASINAAITYRPAPTARASSPRACSRRSHSSQRRPAPGWRARSRPQAGSGYSSSWQSPSVGVLGGTPDPYHTAGLKRGTATSTSTKPGTTSVRNPLGFDLIVHEDAATNAVTIALRHDAPTADVSVIANCKDHGRLVP